MILRKQHFPSVYRDVKKFICICYTSLFDLSPASLFINICMEERVDSTRTGFQIFENFVWAAPVNISDNQVSLPSFFNDTVDTFKKSIKGFLRIETPYIDTILDDIKLSDGNVPILNVINSSSPITVENIKALVGAVGIPFINTQERGCFFPSLDHNGAPDVVHLLGITWIYELLIQRDKSKKGICPLVTMCGQFGTYCYDMPWLEEYEKCSFNLITADLNIRDKFR